MLRGEAAACRAGSPSTAADPAALEFAAEQPTTFAAPAAPADPALSAPFEAEPTPSAPILSVVAARSPRAASFNMAALASIPTENLSKHMCSFSHWG